MGEHIETKDGEQYPLLKIDSGGRDCSTGPTQLPPCVVTGCHITRTSKQSWMDRLPEFVSACWITFILIGISFLAFYTLGMNAYRRQPLIITKCNVSKPASMVFFHHIVPRGSYMSFMVYSDYISSVAMLYPSLYINAIFLMDDSTLNSIHVSRNIFESIFEHNNKKEIKSVQEKYPNVNVTIMPLSKYMALTPHRYKWRTIPIYYLNFYVRIFAVWQYGGVAMDLTTYNNIFNMHQHLDRKICAILKQHNDGIENEKYVNTLKKINQEEQNELFTMFYLMIHHVLNQTCSFLNRTLWYNVTCDQAGSNLLFDQPLLRNQRSKRDSHEIDEREISLKLQAPGRKATIGTITNNTETKNNEIKNNLLAFVTYSDNLIPNISATTSLKDNIELGNDTFHTENSMLYNVTNQPVFVELDNASNYSRVKGEISPNIFFYDVSILTDSIPIRSDPLSLPKPVEQAQLFDKIGENVNLIDLFPTSLPILTINSDGTFVAAPSRHHPMLGYLISQGCQRVSPIFAINRALMSQCSGIYKNDMHCDNIYVL